MLGWVVLVAVLGLTVWVVRANWRDEDPYSTARMSQDVRIRCAQTGEEWVVTRGLMEMELRAIAGDLDPARGLASSFANGEPVAFPVDRDDWIETIERINREKARLRRRAGGDR